ncbi:MAG: hypothetical protein V7771_18180 [Shewanella psychromarinicola]|uniref:plasmid recombination protein n=1 Tax=Shewanella psychromarinicola TaxID=2487742 RepID=UPI00300231C7
MAGYQFIHVETYARIPSRTHKKQSARNIAREAEREPGACPHVANPLPYKLMYGCKPSEVVDMAESKANVAVDRLGRKLRKDAQIMLGGVVSYPVLISELMPDDKKLNDWLKRNFEFLQKKYGNNLKSIVAHFDESSYFHLHFYAVPELVGNVMNIGQVHQAVKARDLIGGKQAKAKMRAYKESMRSFQDEYFDVVGKPCGLTRQGANSRRLTRSEWKAEQVAAERLAQSLETINFVNAQLKILKKEQTLLLDNKNELLIEQSKSLGLMKVANENKQKVKVKLNQFLNLQSGKVSTVKYLKLHISSLRKQLSNVFKKISRIENENKVLKSEVHSLKKRESELEQINDKLVYQNEVKTKALKQEQWNILDIVKLASIGKINEISEKYNKNNKEYIL